MEHDVLVLPNGSEGKRYKFEFSGRKCENHTITFVIDGKAKPSEFLEDLVKNLNDYIGRHRDPTS